MSHRRRRASRLLLAVLTVIIAAGMLIYVRKSGSRGASAGAGSGGTATVASAVQPGDGAGPSTAPAMTQPALAPTTAPAAQKPESPALAVDDSATLVTETPTIPDGGSANATPAGTSAAATAPAPAAEVVVAAPAGTPQTVEFRPNNNPASTPGVNSSTGTSTSTTPAASAAGAVGQGRNLMQAGKLLEARDAVNSALAAGALNPQDTAAARQLLSEINQTVVFSPRRFENDKWGGTYSVQSGDRLDRIGAKFGVTPALLMRLNNISDARRLRAGATIKVLRGPFHAVVSKSNFRLDLYLGAPGGPDSVFVTSFPVGLGKDDSTPKGRWLVEPQKKIQNPVYFSPRGEGIIEANDPKNPLGEFWIGLVGTDGDAVGKQSYGIHGTIEPNSIGKQESMGCVRLKNEDVAKVFEALTEGKSTVIITD